MALLKALGVALIALITFTTADVSQCCRNLENKLGAQSFYGHNDTDFAVQNTRWSTNARLNPTCIIKPHHAEHVAQAVTVLVEGECEFAIKAGGHTPWSGANSIDHGVVIDLSFLNRTALSPDRSFARLGAGGTWGHAYNQLNGSGVAIPGGRVKTVGVGGLVLGGGYSWLTPKVGWVANNVLNYEIVLASGEVRNVNASSDSDLFMALKGGGNNFGIVTSFDIATFKHDQKIWGGFFALPATDTNTTFQSFQQFVEKVAEGDDDASLVALEFVHTKTSSQDQIINWVSSIDAVDETSALWAYDPLFSGNKLANSTGWTTFADFPNSIPPVARVTFATVTVQPMAIDSVPVLEKIHQITRDVYETLSHVPDLTWDVQYEPLPRAYDDRGLVEGGNIMGLNYTTKSLVIVFLMPLWEDARFDNEVNSAVQKWLTLVQTYIAVHDVGYPFEYLNYAAPFQNPLASYGAHNLQFLKEVSKKYDPDQIFQRLVPGGFKLN
ncbi:Bifunctional solanapyrone synthase [Cercospora beticola]|uniref:Bifunctional solanapyrone synthase n=1 Tax=Cercospora beticola TaxID=122368 RepID=A0A2G5HZ81_CERBT|nr:Bifunctional solanapyrone synthase [Cercospora beticola]PIA97801.1 Bifunctional solanapyrone synthase [Cercospora beticola]WPA98475.1 hypothetical protein RHO25_003087 [Cercospora beticola]CAK1359727.1 unnamed protein product [Cercospora beticola]